jgi:hypothetical protein
MSDVVEMRQSEFAGHRGVSKTAVRKMLDSGRIPSMAFRVDKDGVTWIDVAAADLALGESKSRVASPNELPLGPAAAPAAAAPAARDTPSLTKARERQADYDARLKQLDYEVRIGKLLKAEDVLRSMEICGEAIARDLDQIQNRADDLVTAYTRGGVSAVRVLLREITKGVRGTLAANMKLLAAAEDETVEGDEVEQAPATEPSPTIETTPPAALAEADKITA